MLKGKNKNKTNKKNPLQFEETEQASEPTLAGMLERSDQEFETTMINMLI